MTKVLVHKIDALPPDMQEEVLHYVDELMRRRNTRRMTLDNGKRQNEQFREAVAENLSLVGYKFW